MSRKTPEQIAEKYQRGVAGAGQDYLNGVQNPARSWSQATQAGAARWRASIQEAISKNSFARGVAAAGDAKWQQNASQVGAQRYSGAAATAAQSYARTAGQIMSAAAAAQSAVANMPNETQEQRLARAVAAMRAISQTWASRRAS